MSFNDAVQFIHSFGFGQKYVNFYDVKNYSKFPDVTYQTIYTYEMSIDNN